MANEIKAGDTIGNFRVTSVTTLHEQGETATMLTHEPTGLRWLHFTANDPVSSCAIAVATPATDDRGLPHVLEHMVLSGSKRRPGTDLARGMMNRTVVEEMNATTHSFMTNYHFSSAVESDMRGLFDVWFDAILRPELMDIFTEEIGIGAILDKAIDQSEDGFKTNFKTTSDQLGADKVFGIYGFFEPDYPEDTLWNRTTP